MQQINAQTTNLPQNTPNNTLEIVPPEESKNPRAIAARGAKPSEGQNVPADKLTEQTVSSDPAEDGSQVVEEAFGNFNTTAITNKLNSLDFDTFFTY